MPSISSCVSHADEIMWQYYLEILRSPSLASHFKNACFSPVTVERPPEDCKSPASVLPVPDDNKTSPSQTASAYPFVQPMKAALYFDSAKGFGQWRILISNGAAQDLRQTRKRDPTTFAIIIKKIK